MDAVRLHSPGNVVDIAEDEGEQGDIELFGGQNVALSNSADVVGSVVGRKGDAGEHNFYSRVLERGNDVVEVGASGSDRQAAKNVIASEFHNGDGGVRGDNAIKAVDSVFGGVSANAHVHDAKVVAV